MSDGGRALHKLAMSEHSAFLILRYAAHLQQAGEAGGWKECQPVRFLGELLKMRRLSRDLCQQVYQFQKELARVAVKLGPFNIKTTGVSAYEAIAAFTNAKWESVCETCNTSESTFKYDHRERLRISTIRENWGAIWANLGKTRRVPVEMIEARFRLESVALEEIAEQWWRESLAAGAGGMGADKGDADDKPKLTETERVNGIMMASLLEDQAEAVKLSARKWQIKTSTKSLDTIFNTQAWGLIRSFREQAKMAQLEASGLRKGDRRRRQNANDARRD